MKVHLLFILLITALYSLGQATRNDVVIDEIMADPSPRSSLPGGLPDVEFIELRNASQKAFNLNGWKFSDANATATINSNFILQPDSFVLLGSMASASLLSFYGRCLGLSNFPSLDNDGELIYLTSKEGRLIHAVEYKKSWHGNAVKSDGGWTLEMIDTKNACSGGSNWASSIQVTGGTPGRKNSLDATNQDRMPPALIHAYGIDSLHVVLVFDEPVDSLSASIASNYTISDDIGFAVSAVVIPPLFVKVMLGLKQTLKKNTVYTVGVKKVSDCSNNEIGILNSSKVGLAGSIENFDVVINEILFNPKPDGVDYVEIYNRSEKIIDLKDIYIANRTSTGSPGSLKQLHATTYLLFPRDYLVITENAIIIKAQYDAKNRDAFVELNPLPSFPDDKGTITLFNATGKLIDEVTYSDKWHFKLIENKEGVALEKIDYNKSSLDPDNWHSAATSSGYGTPTYQNSQFRAEDIAEGTITIKPEVFSPDNDGYNDFADITYRFPEPGYVCNITLLDAQGRIVRYVTRNALCGLNGYYRWDGLDEKNNKLPVGIYIMITEVFNLKGKTKKFKSAIVLARKL